MNIERHQMFVMEEIHLIHIYNLNNIYNGFGKNRIGIYSYVYNIKSN